MVLIVLSRGPSSEEWEENRAIITDLYKTTTVVHLQELMIKRGFKATYGSQGNYGVQYIC